ncbi:hypothetical protein D3C83_89300 [compost metagenome]
MVAISTAAKMRLMSSGLLVNTCGPGWMPCSRNAARMMAVAPLPGMPMASSGTKAPPTEAVAAAFAATMPSGAPSPSLCRDLPYWFSMP